MLLVQSDKKLLEDTRFSLNMENVENDNTSEKKLEKSLPFVIFNKNPGKINKKPNKKFDQA